MKELKNPRAVQILEFVAVNEGKNFTALDIDTALGCNAIRSVNGIITRTFCENKDEDGNKVPLMERVPGKEVGPDGKAPKYIHITEAGKALARELGLI